MSPDVRQHRGAHPADTTLFTEAWLPLLRTATDDLSWLLTRDYKMASSLKLVGDRYSLTARQRLAVSRAACSDQSLARRRRHSVVVEELENDNLIIDGFNLIITIEAALSGGALIKCRDDCLRDLSSVHGSYRSVVETESALILIGTALAKLKPATVSWLLDRPISNSGRLAKKIAEHASQQGWPWKVDVVFNPDKEIISSVAVAVTSDSSILERAEKWVNFAAYLIERRLSNYWLLDLRKM